MTTSLNRRLRRVAAGAGCAALLLAAAGCDHAVGSFNRTLQVSGPVNLNIRTGSGDIHVMPGNSDTVQVTGHIHVVRFFQDAQPLAREVESNPPIQQTGSTINIGSNTPNNVSISYDVTAPPNTTLVARTGSGDIRVVNVAGSTNASTGSGDIHADGLGGHVVLHAGSGDIRAGFENANDVNAEAGSGDITLKNVQCILVAHTGSGDIDVSGTPSGGWDLRAGSGDVTLHTGSAHYSIDTSTGSGSVHSDQSITMQGTANRHHLTGDINGGGPTVRIMTGSGDIRIR